MTAVIKGSQDAVENGLELSWTKGEGHTRVRTLEGPYEAVLALYNQYATTGNTSGIDSMRLVKTGAKGTLTCTTVDDDGTGSGGGNTAAANAEWELVTNTIHESVEENAYFDGADSAQSAIAKEAAEKRLALPASVTDPQSIVLYWCLFKGVTDIPVGAPIIRSTLVVNQRSAVTASYASMFTVINAAAMKALVPSSYAWRDALPVGWEWLIQPPQFRKLPNGRSQIIQDYWGAVGWLSYFYSGGTRTLVPA